jgi:general transcription factor 3C polypeptide 3 (transcription factor C subunit 4)
MEYAMCLAKHGRAHESYEICGALDDAVVFYHSREDKFLTHLCWSGKIPVIIPYK